MQQQQQHRPEPAATDEPVEIATPEQRTGTRGLIVRLMYKALAGTALTLAVIGVFVPGLPTTVFVLVAAWAAARSSPRLHAWLLNHKVFGSLLHNWYNGRRVARNAKRTAAAVMAIAAVWLLIAVRPVWWAFIPISIMITVLTWLWRRPEP